MGESQRAIPIFEHVVKRQNQILGPHHSDTEANLEGLKNAYRNIGQKKDLKKLLQEITSINN